MKETRTEVKVDLVRMMCECGGEFKPTGEAYYSSIPPTLWHKCKKCHSTGRFDKEYPYPEYTEVKKNADEQLQKFSGEFAANQKQLPDDFNKVLNRDSWDLYEKEELPGLMGKFTAPKEIPENERVWTIIKSNEVK